MIGSATDDASNFIRFRRVENSGNALKRNFSVVL